MQVKPSLVQIKTRRSTGATKSIPPMACCVCGPLHLLAALGLLCPLVIADVHGTGCMGLNAIT